MTVDEWDKVQRQRADNERMRSRLKTVCEQVYVLVSDVRCFVPRDLAEDYVILRRELGEQWDVANRRWIPYVEEN